MIVPCANLIEWETPKCSMALRIPQDCKASCGFYEPGLTEQERIRATLWADVVAYARANGAAHDD